MNLLDSWLLLDVEQMIPISEVNLVINLAKPNHIPSKCYKICQHYMCQEDGSGSEWSLQLTAQTGAIILIPRNIWLKESGKPRTCAHGCGWDLDWTMNEGVGRGGPFFMMEIDY